MQDSAYDAMQALQARHWWWRGMARLYTAVLSRYLPPNNKRRILDAGCGFGTNFPVLSQFGDVVGIDVSLEALQAIKQRPKLGLVQASASALPFRDDCFDVVGLLAIVEHLQDDGQGLAEAHRVARRNAIQVVLTSAFMILWSHHDAANNHFRRYRASALDAVQSAAGWHVLFTSYVNSLVFAPVLIVRLIQRFTAPSTNAEYDMGPEFWPINPLLELTLRFEIWLMLNAHLHLPVGIDLISVSQRDD